MLKPASRQTALLLSEITLTTDLITSYGNIELHLIQVELHIMQNSIQSYPNSGYTHKRGGKPAAC